LLLSYAVAQQEQSPGQTDRSAVQQADPSAAPSSERAIDETNPNRTNYREAKAATGGSVVDYYLATCLLGHNKAEVELSEIAVQKSENAEVKQFAQKMIQDHNKLIEQLQPLAMMQGGARKEGRTSSTTTLPGTSTTDQAIPSSESNAAVPRTDTTTEITASPNAATTAAGRGGALHELLQIERQINERCLQMARDELQQKSGAEFDKCFVGGAIGAHAKALAALEVIGKQRQGQLAQVAQQAQPTVQQHFEHAKQLMKQLEGQSSAKGTQAQRDSTRTE
jgi:predicted outer membrane protein